VAASLDSSAFVMAGAMNSILSFILKPFITLILSRGDDDGVDIVYPLSIFFAFGIWLVYDRYQKMHNSPVPFFIAAPLVCATIFNIIPAQSRSSYSLLTLLGNHSQFQMPISNLIWILMK
jgi:hypothetical protein